MFVCEANTNCCCQIITAALKCQATTVIDKKKAREFRLSLPMNNTDTLDNNANEVTIQQQQQQHKQTKQQLVCCG